MRCLSLPLRSRRLCVSLFSMVLFAAPAQADIYQWEYINPADPSQGVQQSTTLCPDGAGVNAVPGADLSERDLTMAYLHGADLTGGGGYLINLTNADLSHANLTNVSLSTSTLTGADFTDASISGASLSQSAITLPQLYSTASYKTRDLRNVGMSAIDLAGASFVGQNLSNAGFTYSNLTGADFRQANLASANFAGAILPDANLSQANLVNSRFSQRVYFGFDSCCLVTARLIGANLTRADLTNADFAAVELTNADLTDAEIRGAKFGKRYAQYSIGGPVVLRGSGISVTQISSTGSYRAHDLSRVDLAWSDLTGGNFAGQNLTSASLSVATLTGANFTNAVLENVDFNSATLSGADFTNAEVRRANFDYSSLTLPQLYSTATYQAGDLTGMGLTGNDLSGGDFSGKDLSHARIGPTLTGAIFTGAQVRGATLSGMSAEQLYSTANYQARDLRRITFVGNLSGWSFVGQNLSEANLESATLTGADFTGAEVQGANLIGISAAQLYSTASYQARNLTGIRLTGDLMGWNFVGQTLKRADFSYNAQLQNSDFRQANLNEANFFGAYLSDASFRDADLTNADLTRATLTGTDFTGAKIRGASFDNYSTFSPPHGTGITLEQLYSTASYQAGDLSGVSLGSNNLSGGNFSGINFTNANLYHTNLLNSNLSAADTRGAYVLADTDGANLTNLIWSDGHIYGLELPVGETLVVRDYDGNPDNTVYPYDPVPPIPITVDQHLTMGPGGTLRMVFEADAWDSTISFAPGIPVTLGGTLELTFAADVDPASQLGRTFDLFDWFGVEPTGTFAIASPYVWNVSDLYTTGAVTLTAIPEPTTMALVALGMLGLAVRARRTRPRNYLRSQGQEECHAEPQSRRGIGVTCLSLRSRRLRVSLFSMVLFAALARADGGDDAAGRRAGSKVADANQLILCRFGDVFEG